MMMDTFAEYNSALESLDTDKYTEVSSINGVPRDVFYALGMAEEAGEVAGKIKKVYRDSGGVYTPELKEAIILEMGDCLWYMTRLAVFLGFSLGMVAIKNAMKLYGRKQRGTTRGSGDDR